MYTKENYRALLKRLVKNGYHFGAYDDSERKECTVLLRHDIDFSLDWAVECAKINHEEGAIGTFFFQLRSPLYNLHSFDVIKKITRIAEKYGQIVAFHYVLPHKEVSLDEIKKLIAQDYQRAQKILPMMVPVYTLHNPSVVPELYEKVKDFEIEGMVNGYAHEFVTHMPYYGDSNLRYTVEQFEEIIDKQETMQLMLSPLQWLSSHTEMIGILLETMHQILKEKETGEFMTNHFFKAQFPHGIMNVVTAESFAQKLQEMHSQ